MSVRAVLDALMPALEPRRDYRDDSRARFVELAADPQTLYGWPRSEQFDPDGTGEMDLERFGIRLAWALDATDEVAAGTRLPETSARLFDWVDALAAWVRLNRRMDDANGDPVWEHLRVSSVDWQGLISNDVRGVFVDLDGWTLRG